MGTRVGTISNLLTPLMDVAVCEKFVTEPGRNRNFFFFDLDASSCRPIAQRALLALARIKKRMEFDREGENGNGRKCMKNIAQSHQGLKRIVAIGVRCKTSTITLHAHS